MGGGRLGVASKTGMWSILCSMKQQISNRLGVAHVRDTMMQFITGAITRQQAMESLQVGQSQLYSLRTSYLAARAQGRGDDWEPGSSGGNHMPTWPDKVQSFLRRALEPDGDAKRYSYAFAASEVGRRFGFPVDRSQVRHWAIAHNLHLADHRARPPAHVRRWQRKSVGELWQLDATPDYFLGRSYPALQLIDMVDDCSRMQVGCRLYQRETVASYLDLFYRSFTRYGLPLEIYVDKAGFFRNDDGSLTQLGRRLKFVDVSFVFANTPEAKGKIERVHQVWQERLPAYAAREGITGDTPLEEVNEQLDCLVDYRNGFERHRELHDVPLNVWTDKIVSDGGSLSGRNGRVRRSGRAGGCWSTAASARRNAQMEPECGSAGTSTEPCLSCSTSRKRERRRKWCSPTTLKCTGVGDGMERCRGGVPKRQPGLQNSPAVLAWVAANAQKPFRFCSLQIFRF